MRENKETENQLSMFDYIDTGYTEITKSYITSVPDSGLFLAEAFGIGDGHVTEISNIQIPNDYDVLYITGESGSGKTTILEEYTKKRGLKPYAMTEEEKQTPIFLLGGSDTLRTIRLLTSVGLSDAVLWMNNYYQLSDSQKVRCEIAMNMMHRDVVIVDEFLSTLDRETALPVAYSIQKAIRKYGKKMIAVTAHTDLAEYLMPDVILYGNAFPSRWEVVRKTYDKTKNPVLKNVRMSYGTKEDYKEARLGELHYKGKYTGGTKEYLFAHHNERLIALIVSTYNMHTGGRRISRVVVHPSYRGCGVGKELVKRYISDFPNTDVLAAMALINPIFERAGMVRLKDTDIKPPSGLEKRLVAHGFDVMKWGDKGYDASFSESEEVRAIISDYAKKASSVVCPGGKRVSEEEIKRMIMSDKTTAGRVLFSLRPRKMARYMAKSEVSNE